MNKTILLAIVLITNFIVCFLISTSEIEAQTTDQINRTPARIFGLTVDESSTNNEKIIQELLDLKRKNPRNDSLTVRIVLPVTCNKKISKDVCGKYGDKSKLEKRYGDLLREAHKHFVVIAEIMDSTEIYSAACFLDKKGKHTREVEKLDPIKSKQCYRDRTEKLYNDYKQYVDIWEFGNEVNGMWYGGKSAKEAHDENKNDNEELLGESDYLKKQEIVFSQLKSAYQFLHDEKKARTAITYYFNDANDGRTSYTYEAESMIPWIERGGSEFKNVDYVLISYYPDENYDTPEGSDVSKPIELNAVEWENLFTLIRKNYSAATRYGIGEMGTHCKFTDCNNEQSCKQEENNNECDRNSSCCLSEQRKIIKDYYTILDEKLRRQLPAGEFRDRFIGGYFYWFYSPDVINKPPDSETQIKSTRKAVWDAFINWNQPIDSEPLSITADVDNKAISPEIKILQPGDTSKTNPYTIVIINNPAITSEDGLKRDPINDARGKFDKSTDYIYGNLFAKLPGQAENFLANKSITDKIRVVSLWVNAPADESYSFIEIVGQFQARQTKITNFLAELNRSNPDLRLNPDVVFAVTGWEHKYKATAFAAREENCQQGIKFWFDKKDYKHCFTSNQPGVVAINAEDDSMTALHEFGHAASSYDNGYVDDLNNKKLNCNCRLTVNKKRKGWFNNPKEFAVYYLDSANPSDTKNHYALDKSDTRTEKGIFAPIKNNSEFPALMDDYHEAENGNSEKCQHDKLTRQFLLDRIRAKTMR